MTNSRINADAVKLPAGRYSSHGAGLNGGCKMMPTQCVVAFQSWGDEGLNVSTTLICKHKPESLVSNSDNFLLQQVALKF